MSMDQCHSTVDERPVVKPRSVSHAQVGTTGKKYWRSLDDAADAPQFREFLEREFPTGASQLLESSRRTFLKIMGASVALAGAATLPGCRRPDHKIYAFSKSVPEDAIPGKALYFATSLPLHNGAVEGVIVECVDGRPIKIEGNPLHPSNAGKSSAFAQASILDLYDPDRLKDPVYTALAGDEATKARSWDDFAAWVALQSPKWGAGEKLAIVVDKRRSQSRDAIKAKLLTKYPKARWVAYDPVQSDEVVQGSVIALGSPHREVLNLEKADVVVSFERDFLHNDPDAVRNSRGWASKRRVMTTRDWMSRVYVAESHYTVTGSKADHRVRMSSTAIPALAVSLAKKLVSGGLKLPGALSGALDAVSVPTGVSIDDKLVSAMADDLMKDVAGRPRAPGTTLIVAGPTQPAPVHALVFALNSALGNVGIGNVGTGNAGATVSYIPMSEDEASSSVKAISELAKSLNDGTIDTLVCVGVNPAFDSPGDTGFAKAMTKAQSRITASYDTSETIAGSTWQLPLAHTLESWGDSEAHDGSRAPIQPMIAPIFGAKSDLEILAMIAGDAKADGHAIVQAALAGQLGKGADVEKNWRRALFNGVLPSQPAKANVKDGMGERVAQSLKGMSFAMPPTSDAPEVVFTLGAAGDGRFAGNAWMQERPDPITKVVWDNVALVSETLGEKYGLRQDPESVEKRHAKLITILVNGQSVTMPAWVFPGVAENTVVVALGYGRTHASRAAIEAGFNAYPISGVAGASRFVAGKATIARVTESPRTYQIVSSQNHGSMEGRALVRELDLVAWKKFGDDPYGDVHDREHADLDPYGKKRNLNLAERLGELSHTPANVNIYENPQRGTVNENTVAGKGAHTSSAGMNKDRLPDFASSPQWGMSIDLTTCTGCSSCVVACQSENNIPVVGKIEVNKHREMHWIRVDRYFSSDKGNTDGTGDFGVDPDGVMHQPVACVHCENAPCETVCPVNATVHGPEGINYMAYNRCIGTRYCANNCPYKVRRFNFFDYGTKQFKGDYIGREVLETVGADPKNVNLIPPRLRERVSEVAKMRTNPNVTVRSRGVMEKCSYCVQRINEARIEVKLKNLEAIPDGMFQSACQQACPTDAIVFGDLSDTSTKYPMPGGESRVGSRVSQMARHQRTYALLGYLNTRPRTTHMLAVRNPNPALVSDDRKHAWDHPFHHGGGGHDDHHGHDHGGHDHDRSTPAKDAHGGEKHSRRGLLIDPLKRVADTGYKVSLGILNA